MSRRSIALTALLVAMAAGGLGYWRSAADGEDAQYVTETVDAGSIMASVTAAGAVNPVKTVQVGTYVSGPIIAIDVDFNSPVRRGQRVAKIDPAPFQVRVRKAEANVATARARVEKSAADLALKKLTLERQRALLAKQLIPRSDVDDAESSYAQAQAQLALDAASVQQAEAELDEARISLAYTDIRSPVDGIVVARNVDVGQTVAASFQTPTLFLIAEDLTKMQVDANVSESDIGSVQVGQPATFSVDAYPGREFHGTVSQVRNAPINVQNVVTYDVVIAVDNPDLVLRPGMTATVSITTARRDGVRRIPLRALRFRPESGPGATAAGAAPGSGAVWRLGAGGRLERVEVSIGVQDDRYAELVAGDIREGERLVVARKRTEKSSSAPRLPFGGPRYR